MASTENGAQLFTDICEVISSGSFIQYKKEPMYLKLSMVTFKFVFEDNEEKKPRLVREYKQEDNTVVWTFQNYNNDIGIGTAEPIATGTVDNKSGNVQVAGNNNALPFKGPGDNEIFDKNLQGITIG